MADLMYSGQMTTSTTSTPTAAASPIPGHINETTGAFCSREGQMAPGGRCPDGCDHADHYSNDGHPECEDRSGEPKPLSIADCTCLYSCADDPITACSLSGAWHVHPQTRAGVTGACPLHPDAPGDL